MDHKNTHLTEEELALYAEALNRGDLSNVSSSIRQHIAECDECAMEAINISDILSEEEEKTNLTTQKNQNKRKPLLILIASIVVVIIVIILILYN